MNWREKFYRTAIFAKQYLRDSLLDLLSYAELTLLLMESGGWLYVEHHSFVSEEAIGEDGFCFA